MSPEEPTDEIPGGSEGPTEVTPSGEEATGRIPEGNENPTEALPEGNENPTEALPEGNENPTEALAGSGQDPTEVKAAAPGGSGPAASGVPGGNKGIGVLVAAIVASLLLVGAYVAAGGPVGPDAAADPCDPRPWTNPGNLEETAQQFALSAADGAACELGVSREELTRAIADEQSRMDFMAENGISDAELEDALRAGLNRAVDDAENAGALTPLAAAGIRLAIRVMPMSVMLGLLENAEGVFNGDLGSFGGIGDAIDAIGGGVDNLGSGNPDDPLGGLGDALEQALPEGTTDDLQQLIPEETRKQLEEQATDALQQGLDDLLGP